METDDAQLRITFEEYRKVSNLLIMHMREYEDKARGELVPH